MQNDNIQLPAIFDPNNLAAAVREKLKDANYDERILEAVGTLAEVGIMVPREATPPYVRAKLFQRGENLREMQQSWAELAKETRKEINGLKSKLKKVANDPEQAKEAARLEARIDKLTNDVMDYDSMQLKINNEAEGTDDTLLKLDEKMKPRPSTGGSRSWDPDASNVNVNVNVGPNSDVSVDQT